MFDGNAKYEAWIYSVGALKLLSGNLGVRKTIVNTGCIEALGIVLTSIIQQVKLLICFAGKIKFGMGYTLVTRCLLYFYHGHRNFDSANQH